MGARLHLLGGAGLDVDESAGEASRKLQAERSESYPQLHRHGKAVFVNPSAVAYIEEAGTREVEPLQA